MDWSIQEVARLSGLTGRTLRYYDQTGLLRPSRVEDTGVRRYDETALLKLQDILLFRRAGVPLKQIHAIVPEQQEPVQALRHHLAVLEQSQRQLDVLKDTVRHTLARLENGEQLMAEDMLQGFDSSQYEEEVVENWGREAYDEGQRRFEAMSAADRAGHAAAGIAIAREFAMAWEAGARPDSPESQEIASRHYSWVAHLWTPDGQAYAGLGAMYRDDPRFAQYYTEYVDGDHASYLKYLADTISHYAANSLS